MSEHRAQWQAATRWGVSLALLAWFGPARAADVVSCRMPNGDVRIVAVPPEGCVVTEPYKLRKAPRSSQASAKEVAPAPEPKPPPKPWPPAAPLAVKPPEQPALTGDELARFLEGAMENRRVIELRAEAVGEKLEHHRERVADLPPIAPEDFQSSPHGSGAYVEAMRKRADELEQLRAEELTILAELDQVEDEFSRLSRSVVAANGGELPDDWSPQLQCKACPRS